MTNAYEELANAVVLDAVNDYRKALKALTRNPNNKKVLAKAAECERFFRSDWYRLLTSVDGEMLMRKLRQEVSV